MREKYVLRREWTLPEIAKQLPAFEGERIRIEPTDVGVIVTVKPYGGCDGATGVPDWPRGVRAGAIFHDAWYLDLKAMAAAWQWPEAAVRKVGDDLFWLVMRRTGASRAVAWTYWWGVRVLGGAYRAMAGAWRGVVTGLAFALFFGGCGGCTVPAELVDPDAPIEPPDYEMAEARGGAVCCDAEECPRRVEDTARAWMAARGRQ